MESERDINFCLLIHTPRLEQAEARELELHLGLSCACKGPSTRVILCCFSRCVSRELG